MTLRGWPRGSRLLPFTLAIAVALAPESARAAESVAAPALKAAFLLNFVKLTEWPADALPAGETLAVCFVGDNALAEAFTKTAAGRLVDGHGLSIRRIAASGPIRSCHLLYVSGLDKIGTAQLFEGLKGAAVLTVGDRQEFADAGGVVQLFVEDSRMRFAINVASADRARLRLSSKLLSLAKLVKGEHDVQR